MSLCISATGNADFLKLLRKLIPNVNDADFAKSLTFLYVSVLLLAIVDEVGT